MSKSIGVWKLERSAKNRKSKKWGQFQQKLLGLTEAKCNELSTRLDNHPLNSFLSNLEVSSNLETQQQYMVEFKKFEVSPDGLLLPIGKAALSASYRAMLLALLQITEFDLCFCRYGL
ncbi:MAG: hypothetical protein SFY66_05015 [Oculatellaceae cyanobacterium bins.114]|nr:hypothetical protein [Oculatellaceae cyanobacterium bins.114]